MRRARPFVPPRRRLAVSMRAARASVMLASAHVRRHASAHHAHPHIGGAFGRRAKLFSKIHVGAHCAARPPKVRNVRSWVAVWELLSLVWRVYYACAVLCNFASLQHSLNQFARAHCSVCLKLIAAFAEAHKTKHFVHFGFPSHRQHNTHVYASTSTTTATTTANDDVSDGRSAVPRPHARGRATGRSCACTTGTE